MKTLNITIAGAGIGGLVAGLMLHAEGHKVRVYEAVADLKPLGVGINLLPHAALVLDGLGLTHRLLAQGVATRELVYFNRHGQKIWGEPRGRFAGNPAPQISLSRGALQFTLFEALGERIGPANIVCDRRYVSNKDLGERVVTEFVDGEGDAHEVESDILICADGIRSTARAHHYPDEGPPVYSGRILWRATSFARPYLTGATMIMAGHQDQKFVCYPIEPVRDDGLQRINWIAELRVPQAERRGDWNRLGDLADFLPKFESWDFGWLDVPGLIRVADEVYEYPMVDRDPVEQWSFGRMSLLGDAAHPMFPIGSNGASQAILDSQALCAALREHAEPAAALRAYEQARLPATAAIVRANRQNGPEHCMQLAEDRAPEGFERIEDIFAEGELEAMADRYKQIAGMKVVSSRVPAE